MPDTLELGTSSLGNRFVAFEYGIDYTHHKRTGKEVIYSEKWLVKRYIERK